MSDIEWKPKKPGPKEVVINESHVYAMAHAHVPTRSIAQILGVSEDIVQKRFADLIRKAREDCKSQLRAKQIEIALQGNVTMLIFLGKNMLDQSDRSSIELLESIPDEELERKVKTILAARGMKKIEGDE